MRYQTLILLLLLSSLASTVANAQSTTTTLSPIRDNTLYERVAGDVSNGAGEHLFFGQTGANAGNVLRRAIFTFDFAAIPPGSVITDVQLSFTVNMVPPGSTSFDANVHRVIADWGEGTSDAPGPEGGGTSSTPNDATWIHTFFDTDLWANPGGDFSPTSSATTNIGTGAPELFTFSSAQLIADAQDMVNTPASNFGWVILGDENGSMNARRIASRENPTAINQPSVEITFEPGALLPVATAVPALNRYSIILLMLFILCTLVWKRVRLNT